MSVRISFSNVGSNRTMAWCRKICATSWARIAVIALMESLCFAFNSTKKSSEDEISIRPGTGGFERKETAPHAGVEEEEGGPAVF